MKKIKLAAAIKTIAAGSLVSLALASNISANVMYNTYNQYASNLGTDAGAGGPDGWSGVGMWVGTSDNNAPFGSIGLVTNWGVELGAGGSQIVSSQNAHDLYGVWADIDTARGAWNDKGEAKNPTTGVIIVSPNASQGWGHNTDIGLFKSDVTQIITISATSLNPTNVSNFGLSVFTGMDSDIGYIHHGGWNINYRTQNNPGNTAPAILDNPLGTVGLTFLTYSDNSTVSFTAQAGLVYSILLGGYSGAGNFGPHAGYSLNISSVPIPGAVWLFGSAFAGLMAAQRRKKLAV